MPTKAPKTFSDQIRTAVDGSGQSRYRICAEIGVAQATMSRFMNGKGGLSMNSLDRLAALLSLSVVAIKGPGSTEGGER
jgi:transcriptional regulator with XRE-family HTH domain